jgi:hypothetical protein
MISLDTNRGRKLGWLMFAALAAFVVRLCLAWPNAEKDSSLRASEAPSASHSPAPDLLGRLPITFERNLGQGRAGFAFLARAHGTLLQFGSREIRLAGPGKKEPAEMPLRDAPSFRSSSVATAAPDLLVFSFAGSTPRSRPEAMDLLATKTNYYLGREPSNWHTDIPNFGKVRYAGLYRGIDLIFHGEQGSLEYDFVVAAGADPDKIRMRIGGALKLAVSSGSLGIQTRDGEVRLARPAAYQERNGIRTEVESEFRLLGNHLVTFRVGQYDHSLPLVIDPVLDFSSVLALQQYTQPAAVALDSGGDIYVAANVGGGGQPFLIKIDASRTSVDFTTFIDGSVTALAVDTNGYAYLLGNANSGFPTSPGAFRTTCPATITDCGAPYVTKFDASGTAVYSTYLSPGANARALAVDQNGNTYITGGMQGPGLDIVNAFEPAYQGMSCSECDNAFVQELNSTGTALVYSTYLAAASGPNGVQNTIAVGIAVDSNGSAYVTGNNAKTFPTDNNSLTLNSSTGFFVVKFQPDGSDLVYAASIGGNSTAADTSSAIAVDAEGSAYITGVAGSQDFPVTAGAYLAACEPVGSTGSCGTLQQEIFALKMSPDGQSLDYSTYIGSGGAYAMTVDSNGRAFIVGGTAQTDFPTVNPIQASIQVGSGLFPLVGNAFITALDASGIPFFSTFFSGIGTVESPRGIAVDPTGEHVVVGGYFVPYGDPISDAPLIDPLQTTFACCGADVGFVAVLDLSTAGPALSVSPRSVPIQDFRNMGTAPLHISSIVTSDSSSLGGDCLPAHTLPPGSGCFLIDDGPGKPEADSFSLTVNDDNGAETFSINEGFNYSGPGTEPILIPSVNTLRFPTQLVGTLSAPQSFTVTNIGPGTAAYPSASANGEIEQTNNCPAALPSGESCTIQVVSVPVDLNAGGNVTVTAGGASSFFEVFAPVTSSTNALAVSAASVNFGNQYAGIAYHPRILVVKNVAPTAVNLTAVSVSGPYSQTNNCPAPLAVGAECQISVTFSPAGNGAIAGTLTIANDSVGGPLSVGLAGTGLIYSPLSVSPLTMVFGGDITNMPDGPQTLAIGNPSVTQGVTVANIVAAPAQFSITENTCSGPLGPQGTCTVEITFTGTAEGTVSGTVTVTPSGIGTPQVVPLTGTAMDAVGITPSPDNLGDQQVGTTGPSLLADIGNESGAPVTIQSISASGDFQVTQNCWTTLPAQLNAFFGCALGITFSPSMSGPRTGTLTVVASDSTTPHEATLNGNGVGAGLEILPASLSFGYMVVGSTSTPQMLTVKNVSGAAVSLPSISASAPFSQSNNCGATLLLGAMCTVQVFFSPTMAGGATGTLTIQDNAAGNPHLAALSGTGAGPEDGIELTSLAFGNVNLGDSQSIAPITLTNAGVIPLTITSISLAGSDAGQYSQSNTCPISPSVLAIGSSCAITPKFQPTSVGAKTMATLTIADNAPGSPHAIALSGTGVDFTPTVVMASATVTAGSPATFTINVATSGGVTANGITFAASGLPPAAAAVFNPATIPAGSISGGTTLTITTTARTSAPPSTRQVPMLPWLAIDWLAGMALVLASLVALRQALQTPRRLAYHLPLALLLFSIAVASGCGSSAGAGGGGSSQQGTPAGTYPITVTETSGNVAKTTLLSLTVQ